MLDEDDFNLYYYGRKGGSDERLMSISPKTLSAPPGFNSRLICLCWIDNEGKFSSCSPAFENLFRRPGGQMPCEIAPLIHPEDRHQFVDELSQVANGRTLSRRSVRFLSPDGGIIPMDVRAEPGEGGGVMLDLWERPAEAIEGKWSSGHELEMFRDEVKSFINNLFDPVVLVNTEGRIVHVNHPVLELTGYRIFELVGNPVAVLFENRAEALRRSMLRFAKLMRSGQVRDQEGHWTRRDGERIPVTISGSVIRNEAGELCGMVMVARDERSNALLQAVEKKKSELEEAYAELKRLDKMKDDVLSLVGHELRAPLANILGYAEFLSEWKLSEEEKKNFVRIIYQESQHLRRLVNDILDLSRMEAGRMVYHFVRDNVNRVVISATEVLRADAEKKEVILAVELGDEIDPIEIDPDRIQQVVTNIVHNAIKFTPTGKRVTVSTALVEGGIKITIADEGIGIAPEDADRVFSPFEQIIDVRHHHEGAGLGMSIARRIIQEGHGGKIWFESAGKDLGTSFHVFLPEKRTET